MKYLFLEKISNILIIFLINIPYLFYPIFKRINKNKKYILFISPTFFSEKSVIGGGERYTFELAKAISKNSKNKDVIFVTFGEKATKRKYNGLTAITYEPFFKLSNNKFHSINLNIIKDIWSAEVVHCSQYRTLTTIYSLWLAKLFGKKTFVTDHGHGSDNYITKHCHFLVDKFLMVSKYAARMIKAPRRKKVIVYGGVDTEKFYPAEFNSRRDYHLFVGRIMPHKGIDTIIKVLNPNEKLLVIGKAYNRKYFEDLKLMSKNKDVRFLTHVSDKKLVKYYQQAKVCILSSVKKDIYNSRYLQSELLGLVLLEAMACGTPVIGSKLGGIPEIISHRQVGFCITPGNINSMREALNEINDNKKIWKEYSLNARKLAEDKFSWSIIAQNCLKLYGLS